jgi:hypothetical protein
LLENGELSEEVQSKEHQMTRTTLLTRIALFGLSILLVAGIAGADPGGVPAEIAALQSQVASLQATVSSLQSAVSTLQGQLGTINANPVLQLGPYLTLLPAAGGPYNGVSGPIVQFHNINLQIVDGSGATDDNTTGLLGPNTSGTLTGLGNLIIGYDEQNPVAFGRGGSHNLVVGAWHGFPSVGGLVAGFANNPSGVFSTVSGGENGVASGQAASVSGGYSNSASGLEASISGGQFGAASGGRSSLTGGQNNSATGFTADVTGGFDNLASGTGANVSGGELNQATGNTSSILGGNSVSVSTTDGTSP